MKLRFGKVAVVSRTELDRVEAERDAWKERAEALAAQIALANLALAEEKGKSEKPRTLRSMWATALSVMWLLLIGVFVGGQLPRISDAPTLAPDYPACIGKARYENPIEGNQYQELVNALYACDVYEG